MDDYQQDQATPPPRGGQALYSVASMVDGKMYPADQVKQWTDLEDREPGFGCMRLRGENFLEMAALVAERIPADQRDPSLTWAEHARLALTPERFRR